MSIAERDLISSSIHGPLDRAPQPEVQIPGLQEFLDNPRAVGRIPADTLDTDEITPFVLGEFDDEQRSLFTALGTLCVEGDGTAHLSQRETLHSGATQQGDPMFSIVKRAETLHRPDRVTHLTAANDVSLLFGHVDFVSHGRKSEATPLFVTDYNRFKLQTRVAERKTGWLNRLRKAQQ